MLEPLSWHFVPANAARLVDKSLQGPAQAVILDLEDAVAQSEKQAARDAVRALAPVADKQLWLRINAAHTDSFERDLACAQANPAIAGVLVPKVEDAAQLPRLDQLQREGAPALGVGLLIESALGVVTLHAVLSARPSVQMLMFGGAEQGDLMSDLRCDWSPSGIEMQHARQHVLLCARAHGVQPVDGVYARLTDLSGLEADTRLSRSFGYRARASVHPAQLDAIHRIYAASAEELQRAQELVQAFEAALREGKAAVQWKGRLVDYAMYRAAQNVLNSAPPTTETP